MFCVCAMVVKYFKWDAGGSGGFRWRIEEDEAINHDIGFCLWRFCNFVSLTLVHMCVCVVWSGGSTPLVACRLFPFVCGGRNGGGVYMLESEVTYVLHTPCIFARARAEVDFIFDIWCDVKLMVFPAFFFNINFPLRRCTKGQWLI